MYKSNCKGNASEMESRFLIIFNKKSGGDEELKIENQVLSSNAKTLGNAGYSFSGNKRFSTCAVKEMGFSQI